MTIQAVVPVTRPLHRSTPTGIEFLTPRPGRESVPPGGIRSARIRYPDAETPPAAPSDVDDAGDELSRWAMSVMCGVAALVPCSCLAGGPWR